MIVKGFYGAFKEFSMLFEKGKKKSFQSLF